MTGNNNTERLLSAAREAKSKSYSPYSNFAVGAAILTDNGEIFSGCNVENASYPMGQCAEGSAISVMVGQGQQKISEVLVITDKDEFCAPCGGCRQKLLEFSDEHTQVHLASVSGEIKTVLLKELLPLAFDKSDLS